VCVCVCVCVCLCVCVCACVFVCWSTLKYRVLQSVAMFFNGLQLSEQFPELAH